MQTSNKHIFIVTYDYPPSNGGIARLCFELKKYLEKKGLNVTVICPQSTSTDAEEDNHPFCPGDTQYESGCHRNHRGNQMEAQVLLFSYAATDTFPCITETA